MVRNYIRILTAVLFLIPAFFGNLSAQNNEASISGTVTEAASGEFITGITVALFQDGEKLQKPLRGAYSNKFGFYSIAGINPGSYTITVGGIGYETFSKKLTLGNGENLKLDIKLQEQDVKTGEVTVEAESNRETLQNISVSTIDPSFIQKLPSIGGEIDIFRSLQLMPGIKQNTELSSGLYIRGGSPDQNLVLLDGVIVYNPSHLLGFLSTFNSDAIRDVRVIKGAFPAEYGGRLSSVIDMSMKEGSKEKISGSGGISMISSRLLLEGPINENSSFMVSGRRMYFDIFTSFIEDAPDYYFYDLNAKVNYKFSESDQVFLSGYFGRDVFGIDEDEEVDFGLLWGNSTGNLRWMHIVSPKLFTNFSFIYTNYNFQSDISDDGHDTSGVRRFTSYSGIQDFMLRAEIQYFPHEDHVIKSGFEAVYHNFIADVDFDFVSGIFDQNDDEELNAVETAFYIQDEWRITPLLAANIGARLYYFSKGEYVNLEPRLSLSYNLTGDFTLKASGAVANQFLHMITRNDINLPTDLWFPSTGTVKPSRSIQGVLGFETTFNDDMYLLSVEGYYKTMEQLYEYKEDVDFSLFIPLESQFTAGKGESYGVEVYLNKRLGDFTGWIGYTLAWTTRTFDSLNMGKPFPPRYDRRHDVSLVVTYELSESFEIGAAWVYGTGQAYTMPTSNFPFLPIGTTYFGLNNNTLPIEVFQYTDKNGFRLPPYHRLDLNIMYQYTWFKLPFQLSLNIYNVYNNKNPFAMYFDQDFVTGERKLKQITIMPIIPTLGLSFKF